MDFVPSSPDDAESACATDRTDAEDSVAGDVAMAPAAIDVCDSAAEVEDEEDAERVNSCLLYTSPSPRDYAAFRMPSSA